MSQINKSDSLIGRFKNLLSFDVIRACIIFWLCWSIIYFGFPWKASIHQINRNMNGEVFVDFRLHHASSFLVDYSIYDGDGTDAELITKGSNIGLSELEYIPYVNLYDVISGQRVFITLKTTEGDIVDSKWFLIPEYNTKLALLKHVVYATLIFGSLSFLLAMLLPWLLSVIRGQEMSFRREKGDIFITKDEYISFVSGFLKKYNLYEISITYVESEDDNAEYNVETKEITVFNTDGKRHYSLEELSTELHELAHYRQDALDLDDSILVKNSKTVLVSLVLMLAGCVGILALYSSGLKFFTCVAYVTELALMMSVAVVVYTKDTLLLEIDASQAAYDYLMEMNMDNGYLAEVENYYLLNLRTYGFAKKSWLMNY